MFLVKLVYIGITFFCVRLRLFYYAENNQKTENKTFPSYLLDLVLKIVILSIRLVLMFAYMCVFICDLIWDESQSANRIEVTSIIISMLATLIEPTGHGLHSERNEILQR
jgi:hypothetical protein